MFKDTSEHHIPSIFKVFGVSMHWRKLLPGSWFVARSDYVRVCCHLVENHTTLLRHSPTQQTPIKHVQSGENKLRPMATDADRGITLAASHFRGCVLIQQTPTDEFVGVYLCGVNWPQAATSPSFS